MTQDTPAALRAALEAVRDTLRRENDKPGGPIRDTIWHTPHETLFDFIDAALAQAATSAAGGATGDLPEAAWPAGTRGMLGENAYDADQMRQHFNAGREFEASRLAALAAQSPYSGAGPRLPLPKDESTADSPGELTFIQGWNECLKAALAQQGAQNG